MPSAFQPSTFRIDFDDDTPPLIITRPEFMWLAQHDCVKITPKKGRSGLFASLAQHHAETPQVADVSASEPQRGSLDAARS